jgi:hypothetical protein
MTRNDRWATDDLIAADLAAPTYPDLEVKPGVELVHWSSQTRGVVESFSPGNRIVLRDAAGTRHELRPRDGAFTHEGVRVTLCAPSAPAAAPRRFTASGSIEVAGRRARTARGSRIWVEGLHDAELIEQIWGDDLRVEGIVVEPMHGADDLPEAVARFAPQPGHRLGILLDHLVPGSKETQLAARVEGRHVRVTGHPYVDVWEAIKPGTIGLDAWPQIPQGTPWKEGVVAALGVSADPGRFWQGALRYVSSYRDLETPLVNAVEQLIDFVSAAD